MKYMEVLEEMCICNFSEQKLLIVNENNVNDLFALQEGLL